MAEAIIIAPVIEKSVEFVCSQTYQELQYFWKFKNNIQRLRSTMTSLETRREAICLLIDAAKNNADIIGPDVVEWLQKIEMIKKEADEIIQGAINAQMGCCFNCKCPNLKVRYNLSKRAVSKTIEIKDLQGKGEFPRVGYPAPVGQMPFTSPLEVVDFESRLWVEERIKKALLDEKIYAIGICGMGGVGKTTMVKKIADKIKKNKHFDEVVMVVVSQNYDPINVQQQLAENLGLQFAENTLHARAARLYKRLLDQEKKILLLIDDLWKEIDLRAIGIPNEVERKGLKVVLTSRFSRVCSKMDVKEIIEVGVLTKQEAWDLFKKHANISDYDSDVLKGYPKNVADRCQGLPLAINVIGKTLKDSKQLFVWKDALHQLKSAQDSHTSKDNQDMHDKLYSSIAWSVNYLETQRRSLLLLCSLFPEDYEIEVEDLARYANGLQLFKGIEKMSQTRDRLETFIHELTDCYLLIPCNGHIVKLHDVVRDTCLRIASKGDNVHMVSHSTLREWPDKDTYESYTAISLDFDYLNDLPSGMKCSRLQLLRLSVRWRPSLSETMNNLTSLLEVMKNVRVLNINNSGIELPQQSLGTSMSLRTLNLHNCSLVGDLSPLLESLVKVEVLSFYNSSYKGKWPKEIAKLSNLKSLDLRFRDGPWESLPTGALIHLKKLEELYLGLVLHMRLPESYQIITEIGSLSNLNTFEISGCDSHSLAELLINLDVERLLNFFICTSSKRISPYQFTGTMIVHETNIGMLLEPKMKALLSKVDEHFELLRVTGNSNDLVQDFNGGSVFSRLRSLKLLFCEMKYICDTTNSHTRAAVFGDLKILCIKGAEYLEELCHGSIPPGSFAKLKTINLVAVPLLRSLWGPIKPPCLGNLSRLQIHDGKLIRSLFLGSSVTCLPLLAFIDIKSCPKLETLVSYDGQIEKDTIEDEAVFPELQEIRLEGVYSFKTLYSKPEAPTVTLCSTNSNISVFPKLRLLKITGSDLLHFVYVTKNEKSISSLELSKCSLEVCFDFEGCCKETAGGQVAEKVFHNLDSLTLSWLPNLRHLWRNLPRGTVAFSNLNTLYISDCGSLKQLFTLSMAKMLGSLETLSIHYCDKLEAIVGPEETSHPEKVSGRTDSIFERLKHLELWVLPQLKKFQRMTPKGIVAFQKLLTLKVGGCGGLRYLLTSPMVKIFANLEFLDICYCDQMESIIGSEEVDEAATNEEVHGKEEILIPELRRLSLSNLPQFRMLCSQSVDLALPSWNYFAIGRCPKINKFCGGNLKAPELKQVKFLNFILDENEIYLDLETTRKWLKDCELGKRCIDCARYAKGKACDHLSEGSSTSKNHEDGTYSSEDCTAGGAAEDSDYNRCENSVAESSNHNISKESVTEDGDKNHNDHKKKDVMGSSFSRNCGVNFDGVVEHDWDYYQGQFWESLDLQG